MITREDFETLIGRDVRDIVRKYFRLLPPDQQQGALRGTRALEEAIADQLGHHRALGLTLASSRPVMVNVRQLPLVVLRAAVAARSDPGAVHTAASRANADPTTTRNAPAYGGAHAGPAAGC